MTTQDFIKRQRRAFRELTRQNRPLKIAARTTHASMANRIFVEGKNANNSRIGSYSSKSTLAGASSFRNKEAAKKAVNSTPGWRKVKSRGKNVNLFIVPGGYAEIRRKSGLQSNKVDLKFTGDLREDFENSLRPSGKGKLTVVLRSGNQDKVEGNEDRFGEIFNFTKAEVVKFQRTADFELAKIFDL